MAESVINGTDLYCFLEGVPIAHATSHTLSIKTAVIPTSNKDTGLYSTKIPGRSDVTVTCEGFMAYGDFETVVNAKIARLPLTLSLGKKSAGILVTTETYFTGEFIITSYEMTAADNSVATYNVTFDHYESFAFHPTAVYPAIIMDGHTVGWYKPYEVACVVRGVGGDESIYWDMTHGYVDLDIEEDSGNTTTYQIYQITATQVDHFYAGCAIGENFIASGVIALNANNKVRKIKGNHLQQYTLANRPINRVFDGINDYMKVRPAFTLIQPCFIYMLVKPLTFTSDDCLFDGNTTVSGCLYQKTTTPNVIANAGTPSAAETHLTLNTWHVIRCLFNGASSKLIIDANAPVASDFGAGNMGGFTVGDYGGLDGLNFNFEFGEAIVRDISDTAPNEAIIYDYLVTVMATL